MNLQQNQAGLQLGQANNPASGLQIGGGGGVQQGGLQLQGQSLGFQVQQQQQGGI